MPNLRIKVVTVIAAAVAVILANARTLANMTIANVANLVKTMNTANVAIMSIANQCLKLTV